jgi:hypothetical protein
VSDATEREPTVVRDYSRAFKFGEVIGRIGNWRPWWGVATIPQYLAAITAVVVLVWRWRWWAHLPGPANAVVLLAVPVGLWFAAGRRSQIDGRPPTSAALALLAFTVGLLGGRLAVRGDHCRRLAGTWTWTARTLPRPNRSGEHDHLEER